MTHLEHYQTAGTTRPEARNSRLVSFKRKSLQGLEVRSSDCTKQKLFCGEDKLMPLWSCFSIVLSSRHIASASISPSIVNERVNYEYFQSDQICSISSGAVESAVKQIDQRLKISSAQWNQENVPPILAHRCAYLNDLITIRAFCKGDMLPD